MKLNSYPKVYAIGHRQIKGIFDGQVVIEEKIDGSQFSMVVFDGELYCRSKGRGIHLGAPAGMFELAVNTAQELAPTLKDGWVYRCEYLSKPKHNTLAYERVPNKYLILFDIMIGEEDYMAYEDKLAEGQRIGLEVAPKLHEGTIKGIDEIVSLLETDSILGGQKIEGFVVKNRDMFTDDKKMAVGKHVSEKFKESHDKGFKSERQQGKDLVQVLIDEYRTESRWQKAIQHLDEAGNLEGSPRDIGPLMKAVNEDVREECAEEIKEKLFKHFWKMISRGITAGLPEWYKEKLIESEFGNNE